MRIALSIALSVGLATAARADEPVNKAFERDPPGPIALLLSVETGPAYRFAHGESFFLGDVSLLIGADHARWGGGLRIEGQLGESRYGLLSGTPRVAIDFQFRLGSRARLGFDVGYSMLLVDRVTQHDVLGGMMLGPSLEGIVDLVGSPRRGTLYLALRAGVDFDLGSGAPQPTLLLALGWRYPRWR